jgi:uncharacterized protein YfkK (UPF0435 family)
MNGGLVGENESYRSVMQQYVDNLRSKATSIEQKEYLHYVYNCFTNNEYFSPQEAPSFAYAVRSQFAHAGESPQNGATHIKTKLAAIKFSFDYTNLFCLSAGELLIYKKMKKSPPSQISFNSAHGNLQ